MSKSVYLLGKICELYAKRIHQFGEDPRALYWKGYYEQLLRLQILAEIEPHWGNQSILDVGCGFCDLIEVLRARGFCGRYVGVDVTHEVLQFAYRRHSDLEILKRDILENPLSEQFDYVMASGTFNLKFCEDMPGFVSVMLQTMFEHSIVGVAVNYLSTYVDFQQPRAYHTDPGRIFAEAKKLTRRVLLRHDYMPWEFTLYLYRNDHTQVGNVFAPYHTGNEKNKNFA